MKNIIPPAILRLSMEMEKNLKINCPAKAKTSRIMRETATAFIATFERSLGLKPLVIDMKIGIDPSGLIKLKKEAKTIRLNSNIPIFFAANIVI